MTTREFAAQILAILQPLVIPLLGLLVAYCVPLIRRRTRSKIAGDALGALSTLAATVVANAYQTTVNDLRDPAKPGKWDAEAAASVKASVTKDLRALAAGPLRDLALGGFAPAQVDALLSQMIEAAVLDRKQSAPVVIETSIPPPAPVPPVSEGSSR